MPLKIALPLACVALLCGTATAGAAVAEPPLDELPTIELEEIAEEELGEEECEEVEEGLEECEEEVDEGEAPGSQSSEECLLRSASARIVSYAEKNQLKLTIGYTAYESADATITFRKGSLNLGSTRRHLGKSGVIRLTKGLSMSQSEKLDPGDRISVQLQVVGAPKNCNRAGHLSPRLVLSS
ncbi:MAG TPA: hypothetical protein VNP96_12220 [Solirubrobacterales bacterium]|nr:hypothetical protein [Solirubrobacterales bacterium]